MPTKQQNLILNAKQRTDRKATNELARQGKRLQQKVYQAITIGEPLERAFRATEPDLITTLTNAMILAHIEGESLAEQTFGKLPSYRNFSLLDQAVNLTAKRKGKSNIVDQLIDLYFPQANRFISEANRKNAKQLQETLENAIRSGAHIREQKVAIREAMNAIGISFDNPYLYENIARTANSIAMEAARNIFNKDPDIEPLIWGFEFVAILDGRVRNNHAAMHGFKAPKDHPIWQSRTPPLGYGCRCSRLVILNDSDDKSRRVLDEIPDEGSPDKGFELSPEQLLGIDL